MSLVGVAIQSNIATGSSLKTIMQLIAAANHPIEIKEVMLGFAGTSSTAVPIDVWLQRQSTAGTSVAMVAGTDIQKYNDSLAESLLTTGRKTVSAEPTSGDILLATHVHPQGGMVWRPPMQLIVGGGDRIGLRTTAAADVNISASIVWVE
jgi:hypothetical protein